MVTPDNYGTQQIDGKGTSTFTRLYMTCNIYDETCHLPRIVMSLVFMMLGVLRVKYNFTSMLFFICHIL